MKRIVFALVLLLAATALPAFAQNPCTDPVPPLTLNPSRLYVQLPDFDAKELDGGPKVSEFSYALFAEGANPDVDKPLQGPSTMPKAGFTLVAGTCYSADPPAPIPTGQRLVQHIRAIRIARDSIPAAQSAWSGASNPFGAASIALQAPGAPRLRQK